MIHIITNHHETLKWIEIQSTYLKNNTNNDYKVYCGVSDLPGEVKPPSIERYNFDNLENVENKHAYKMNHLSDTIDMSKEDPNDMLVFLDPDALPVQQGWDQFVKDALEKHKVIAISREENIEPLLRPDQRPYPHPCFLATTLGFWKKNKLSWDIDPSQGADCAGVLLKKWLAENNHDWGRLLRSNCFNLHPLNFAVYGHLIYHHGSGNRPIYDSIDIWSRPELSQKYGVSLDLHFPELLEFNQKVSDLVFDAISNDSNFINMYFCGFDRR